MRDGAVFSEFHRRIMREDRMAEIERIAFDRMKSTEHEGAPWFAPYDRSHECNVRNRPPVPGKDVAHAASLHDELGIGLYAVACCLVSRSSQ